jgi:hypothetical protein
MRSCLGVLVKRKIVYLYKNFHPLKSKKKMDFIEKEIEPIEAIGNFGEKNGKR